MCVLYAYVSGAVHNDYQNTITQKKGKEKIKKLMSLKRVDKRVRMMTSLPIYMIVKIV